MIGTVTPVCNTWLYEGAHLVALDVHGEGLVGRAEHGRIEVGVSQYLKTDLMFSASQPRLSVRVAAVAGRVANVALVSVEGVRTQP